MVVGILYFGEGTLPLGYFLFCALASLGVLQFTAAQARLIGMCLLPPAWNRWFGVLLVLLAYAGFFYLQPDLFIPGLAGGELFILCGAGFVVGVLLSLAFGVISPLLFQRHSPRTPMIRESIPLGKGKKGETWLPHTDRYPLVLALRETSHDSLDVLADRLVAAGMAVLMCPEAAAEEAISWLDEHERELRATHCYVVGVGRGADRALRLAAGDSRFQSVLALAPFGSEHQARPGLRWLRETDYVTALRSTWRRRPLPHQPVLPSARIVFGDEDLLVRPEVARREYPNSILVAGARHMTLAAMPAVQRLALDCFQLYEAPVQTVSPMRVEAGE